MQRVLKSIISPFDVFYSKNGTVALGLHGREHQRCAAAQILREKLRSMQLRRSVQTDGVPSEYSRAPSFLSSWT